jgi:hypothetical protein
LEYADYIAKPTIENASELISETISRNLDLFAEKENFIEYMAKRPGVGKLQGTGDKGHGLWTCGDESIDLKTVQNEAANHKGRLWTHVVSLRRDDAERLGYNNAESWKNLVSGQVTNIADNMRIPVDDLKWYAAFHNESHHPHIHLLVYSKNPSKGFLTGQGIENMRSAFAGEIFSQDLTQIYEEKTAARDKLKEAANERIGQLIAGMNKGVNVSARLENLIAELSQRLSFHKGKKVYGYLKPDDKKLIDGIVRELASEPHIAEIYKEWCAVQDEILSTYKDAKTEHAPLWEQETFKSIKNAVIREVSNNFDDNIFVGRQDGGSDEAGYIEFDLPETEHLPIDDILNEQPDIDTEPSGQPQTKDESAESQPRKPDEFVPVKVPPSNREILKMYSTVKTFLTDENTTMDEINTAIDNITETAESGNEFAQYALGKLYFDENSPLFDSEKAVYWYENSAEQGNQYAQYSLGKYLYNMHPGKAVKWLTESAEQGNKYAQYSLGKHFYYGKDIEQACLWFSRSAEQGNEYAAKMLDFIENGGHSHANASAITLLYHLSNIIQNQLTDRAPDIKTDKKLWRKITELKRSHGQKLE